MKFKDMLNIECSKKALDNKLIEKKYGLEFREVKLDNNKAYIIVVNKKKDIIEYVQTNNTNKELKYLLGKYHKIPEPLKKTIKKKEQTEKKFKMIDTKKKSKEKRRKTDVRFKPKQKEDLIFLGLAMNTLYNYLLDKGIINEFKEVLVDKAKLSYVDAYLLSLSRILINTMRTNGITEGSIKTEIVEQITNKIINVVNSRLNYPQVDFVHFVLYTIQLYIEQVKDKTIKLGIKDFFRFLEKWLEENDGRKILDTTEKVVEEIMKEVYKDRDWIKEW